MESQIYEFIRESVKNALKTKLLESFVEKYENAVDTIEYFAYLKSNGEQLSPEQIEQLQEIVEFLKETDASDNPSLDDWLLVAEELLNRDNTVVYEGLNKGTSFTLNGLEPEKAAKMFATKYGVSPSDFIKGKGDTLVYSPKCSSKPKKEVVSKPEGMSVEDYKNKIVIPMNPELKDRENEVWVPVPNKERYFGGAADYSNYYEVSNMGRLRTINLSNAARSTISIGYDAPTRKAMQFHLNHESGMNTCPDVKYMVADAFLGEHDLENNMVIHIDGDYHNNRADNLKWVPRKK